MRVGGVGDIAKAGRTFQGGHDRTAPAAVEGGCAVPGSTARRGPRSSSPVAARARS
ncbi:hypothetical protein SXIM_13720 [Streptomyces xiamenensis]|uniref:Uncharacterized protein n=1 Tax=Streptomyces xiamenensis TaxID=408015 RepID=A0A0F7CNE2_9ACTN|nr:hypothetical protein SXIM_13720 [Streptomyces xiamenensis]